MHSKFVAEPHANYDNKLKPVLANPKQNPDQR